MRIGLFISCPHTVVENSAFCHVSGIKMMFPYASCFNLLLDVRISYGHAVQTFIFIY